MFSGSTKKHNFHVRNFVTMLIRFTLALESGSFLLNSSPVTEEKVCVRVCWNRSLQPKGIWPGKVFFISTQSFSVCHTVQWNYCSLNSFPPRTMAHRRNLHDEDTECKHLCIQIHMSTMKTKHQTRIKIITMRKNNLHCHYNKSDYEMRTVVSGWPNTGPSVYRRL